MKKKKAAIVVLILAAAAAVAFTGVRLHGGKNDDDSESGEVAYVETVSNLADTGAIGMNNRYAGTV